MPDNAKRLAEAYKECVSKSFGYLLFNFTQGCNESLRFATDIFSDLHEGLYFVDVERFKNDSTLEVTQFKNQPAYSLYTA